MPGRLHTQVDKGLPGFVRSPDALQVFKGLFGGPVQAQDAVQGDEGRDAHVGGAVDEDLALLVGIHGGEEGLQVFERGVVPDYRDVDVFHTRGLDRGSFIGQRIRGAGERQVDHQLVAGAADGFDLNLGGLAGGGQGVAELQVIVNVCEHRRIIIRPMIDQTLEVKIGELLRERGLRLAVAESCTGGLIGHRLTNVPGSSTYYMGSVTAYAYEAKVRLLGVRWATLEQHGAVSRETVLEMARGVRHALAADIGLSVSGIAGPGGGTPEKPVGLVWIGLSAPDGDEAWSYIWQGDRVMNKELSAEQALKLLVEQLERGMAA